MSESSRGAALANIRIGKLVEELPFSGPECSRITQQMLIDGSKIREGFKAATRSIDNRMCESVANALKIMKGQRVGTPAHRDQIFQKCISLLQSTPPDGRFWSAYRRILVQFVINRMKNLDNLLRDEEIDQTLSSTSDIFKKIISQKDNYRVSLSEIATFYELWWFPRDASIEEVFKKNVSSNDAAAMGDIKRDLSKQIDSSAREIESVQRQIELLTRNYEADIHKLKASVERLSTDQKRIHAELEKSNDNTTRGLDNIRKEVRSKPDQNAIKELRTSVRDLEAEIQELNSSLKKIGKTIEDQNREMGRINEKIGRKFLGATGQSGKGVRKIDAGKNRIPEEDFVFFWMSKLSGTPFATIQFDDLLATHLFFKAFRCIILQDSALYDSWLSAMGWKKFLHTAAADPSWIKRESCIDLETFCSIEDAPNVFKILNFNSALVEGYLLPNVLPWMDREEFIDRKIALIATPDEEGALKEAVQHFPCMLSLNGRLESSPVRKNHQQPTYNPKTDVFISTLVIWHIDAPADTASISELLNALGGSDVQLPPAVLSMFSQLLTNLQVYFDHNSSMLTAYQFVIMPWLKLCKSEIFAEQVNQNMKVIYG